MFNYYHATRHPWSCLLFLIPLLAAYEGGLAWIGGDQDGRMRNGADAWLRWGLEVFGARQVFAAPAVILVVMLLWSWWRWADRPKDTVTTFFGMAFESCLFALALWQFSRNFGPILDGLGLRLQIVVQTAPLTQVLTYIGAGIYEEVLFRLVLFTGLYVMLRIALLPRFVALPLATVGAALAFAAAHHIGPYGEPMRADYFVFRTCAGLYFTVLYVVRGFGIAVGAHAGYDVLVGTAVH
jgi:hypothetical protein